MITGAFSIARQAVQLGDIPRMRIKHTSRHAVGQIYIPFINWTLLVGVLTLVFAFQHSSNLAAAYGIAVTGTITITTILFFAVVRSRTRRPLWQIIAAAVGFLIVDLGFLSANLTKIIDGGWIPILVAVGVFSVLSTWQQGRRIVTRKREQLEGRLEDSVRELHDHMPRSIASPEPPCFSAPATPRPRWRCAPTSSTTSTLHEHVVILRIETLPIPHVAPASRLQISDLGFRDEGISHITARFGFEDNPNVPQVLRDANDLGLEAPLEVRRGLIFLVQDRAATSQRPRHEPMAKAPVSGHLTAHDRPGTALRAAARAHRPDGLAPGILTPHNPPDASGPRCWPLNSGGFLAMSSTTPHSDSRRFLAARRRRSRQLSWECGPAAAAWLCVQMTWRSLRRGRPRRRRSETVGTRWSSTRRTPRREAPNRFTQGRDRRSIGGKCRELGGTTAAAWFAGGRRTGLRAPTPRSARSRR